MKQTMGTHTPPGQLRGTVDDESFVEFVARNTGLKCHTPKDEVLRAWQQANETNATLDKRAWPWKVNADSVVSVPRPSVVRTSWADM